VMLFDCHLHTTVSPDGRMSAEEAISAARRRGLGCIFTEHVDLGPRGEPFFCADFAIYPEEYLRFKSADVGVGVEMGLIPECVERCREIAAMPELDYVAGAIHVTNGIDIGYDPDSFFAAGEGVYADHLARMLEMVQACEYIDALAHIDYISRYSPFSEPNVQYGEYADEYDEIFRAALERNTLLELSTRRINDKTALPNLLKLYKRYRELGGRYAVIGSDAHESAAVGHMFDEAAAMLGEIGLTPVYFSNRRMELCTQTFK